MSGPLYPPSLRWKTSEVVSKTISDVASEYSILTFNYPTYVPNGRIVNTGQTLLFYLYGQVDPNYGWPDDFSNSPITCDGPEVTPRTCSFTIQTGELKSFKIDVVANYSTY